MSALYPSPSPLSADARERITASLGAILADGIDLHGQIKVAHWNVKGPQFAALHPLFETFADGLALHNDALAGRAVTLGAVVRGSARHVAAASRLPDYPPDTVRDLDHVRLLAERFDRYLAGLRTARTAASEQDDGDTADLIGAVIGEFEKHAWFLRATLA